LERVAGYTEIRTVVHRRQLIATGRGSRKIIPVFGGEEKRSAFRQSTIP
jgi:hypothetical protein